MTTKEEDTADESFFSIATQSLLLNMDVPNTTFTQQKQQTTVKISSFNFKGKTNLMKNCYWKMKIAFPSKFSNPSNRFIQDKKRLSLCCHRRSLPYYQLALKVPQCILTQPMLHGINFI